MTATEVWLCNLFFSPSFFHLNTLTQVLSIASLHGRTDRRDKWQNALSIELAHDEKMQEEREKKGKKKRKSERGDGGSKEEVGKDVYRQPEYEEERGVVGVHRGGLSGMDGRRSRRWRGAGRC